MMKVLLFFALAISSGTTQNLNYSISNQVLDSLPRQDEVPRTSWREIEGHASQATLTLCPDVVDFFNHTKFGVTNETVWHGTNVTRTRNIDDGMRYYNLQRLQGTEALRFYIRSTKTGQMAGMPIHAIFLRQLRSFLQLPDAMGTHQVAVHINGLSVTELEDALTYAWGGADSTSRDLRAQIVFLENGTMYFSGNGIPLMVILYILRIPDPPKVFAVPNLGPHQTLPANASVRQLKKVIPPSVEDFRQLLLTKGIILHYDTPMFPGAGSRAFLKANQTNRGSEYYRAKNDLFELAMQERAKRGCLSDPRQNSDII